MVVSLSLFSIPSASVTRVPAFILSVSRLLIVLLSAFIVLLVRVCVSVVPTISPSGFVSEPTILPFPVKIPVILVVVLVVILSGPVGPVGPVAPVAPVGPVGP